MPTSKRAPVPFAVTLLPPLVLAVSYPDVFFNALEFAGVFGVLVLFGVLPGAMAWVSRGYLKPSAGRNQVYLMTIPQH
jgi:tyrosine-specific transport protein